MRRSVQLHSLAESDLIDVWEYSCEQWDAERADRYLDELDRGMRRLADDPDLGAKRDEVRSGYRVIFIGRHAVYYTFTASIVRIVRVLHQQMDPHRHL